MRSHDQKMSTKPHCHMNSPQETMVFAPAGFGFSDWDLKDLGAPEVCPYRGTKPGAGMILATRTPRGAAPRPPWPPGALDHLIYQQPGVIFWLLES